MTESGEQVEAIVVQIHNTPWGEEHCYVLGEAANEQPGAGFKRFQFAKAFHVSPFMPMDIWYDWRFKEPGETLSVHFMNYRQGQKIFDATLTLARRELTPRNLTRVLLSYPPMTLKVITMIHWQALRLWLKGAVFHRHPKKRQALPGGSMTPREHFSEKSAPTFPSAGVLDRLARRLVFRLLKKLRHGRLTLVEQGKSFSFGEPAGQAAVQAAVTVHHPGFYRSVIGGGSRGLGEAYIEGWWSADDLTAVIRVLARNLYLLEKASKTWLGVAEPFYQTLKALSKHPEGQPPKHRGAL
jgi:hypothetical protein